jgi:peptidoglycan/LPS O-acetylase OafA/YrhL
MTVPPPPAELTSLTTPQTTTSPYRYERPDTTSSGKARFEVLDGLRGSAAFLILLFHIQGITVLFEGPRVVLHHAPLAVDFFFALSGFVVGYAYDDRWPRMTMAEFARVRLSRLHPLLVLGTLLGFASYVLDPFAGGQQQASWPTLLTTLGLMLFVLPARPLPNRWLDTHPFNGPAWTLLQEYIANVAYALWLRRLSARALGVIAVVAGTVLVGEALHRGSLDAGFGWDNWWMAPIRLAYPFVTGLLLYRVRDRLPRMLQRLRGGWLPLSALLTLAFLAPIMPEAGGVRWNGLYEAACVVLLFPAIIIAGVHGETGARTARLCNTSGRLSYPLYITHFPFLYVYSNVVLIQKAPARLTIPLAVALVPFQLFVAWAAAKWWDEPIRARLRR